MCWTWWCKELTIKSEQSKVPDFMELKFQSVQKAQHLSVKFQHSKDKAKILDIPKKKEKKLYNNFIGFHILINNSKYLKILDKCLQPSEENYFEFHAQLKQQPSNKLCIQDCRRQKHIFFLPAAFYIQSEGCSVLGPRKSSERDAIGFYVLSYIKEQSQFQVLRCSVSQSLIKPRNFSLILLPQLISPSCCTSSQFASGLTLAQRQEKQEGKIFFSFSLSSFFFLLQTFLLFLKTLNWAKAT